MALTQKEVFVLFLMVLVVAVLGILVASLIVAVDREGLTPMPTTVGVSTPKPGSVSGTPNPTSVSPSSIQAVEEIYQNIQTDFVNTVAASLASIRIQDLGYPTQDQFQTDLLDLIQTQKIPVPPLVSKEYIQQYYNALTQAAVQYKGSTPMQNYAANLSKQLPYQAQYNIDSTISGYDSKISSFINANKSTYTTTFL